MNRESFTDILMDSLKGRRLFIKMGATNGRLGIDSLSAYAMAVDADAVLAGSVFAFCTKMHNQIRLLLWDDNAYWLLTKKIYAGYYIWPERYEERESIEACYAQLRVLLKDSRAMRKAIKKTCEELESAIAE